MRGRGTRCELGELFDRLGSDKHATHHCELRARVH